MHKSKSKVTVAPRFHTEVDVNDEVFLTPRVLDQGAFREYSESLKNLIREANGKRTDLKTDSDDARQLCENLTTLAARLRERLETTAKLLPTLDDRVKRAERLLDTAAENSKLPQKVEEILRAGVAEMERRVDTMIAQAEQRLQQVEARLERARQAGHESEQILETLEARVDEAVALATARLGELEQKLENRQVDAIGRLEQAATSAGASAAQAELRGQQVVESVDQKTAELEESIGQLQQQLTPLVRQAEEVRGALSQKVREATEALEAATAETVKKVHAVELITKRTIRLLGFDPSNPGDEVAPDSLMMLVQRGDELEKQARVTRNELCELSQISDQLREELSECVHRSGETLETYKKRGLDMILNLERRISPLCDQNAALLEQILAARDLLAELDAQTEGTDSEVAGLRDRAVAELTALREQAAAELTAIQQAIAEQRRNLESLRTPPDESRRAG